MEQPGDQIVQMPFDGMSNEYFLPQALPVMGMQHIVHNLLKEVHTSLVHWNGFWAELKNIEALLNWRFRRQRFIVTCVRATPFANTEHLFEQFSQSLYEARWHEVSNFVRKLLRLLGALRSTWDADGVQDDGPSSSAQAAAFDPVALTR